MKTSLSATIFFTAAVAYCRAQFRDLEGCTVEALEQCGTEFVVYANTTTIAEGGKEMEHQCGIYLEQLACSKNVSSRCLYGLPRAVALLGLGAAIDFYDETCDESTPLRQEYSKVVGCLNRAGPQINQQLTKARLELHTIARTAPQNKKVDFTCCIYHDFIHATRKDVDETCPGGDQSAFFIKLMDHIFGEILSLVCGSHTHGSAACEALGTVNVPSDLKPDDARSYIGPLVNVAHSLGRRSR